MMAYGSTKRQRAGVWFTRVEDRSAEGAPEFLPELVQDLAKARVELICPSWQ
jgi:hypothetical protein